MPARRITSNPTDRLTVTLDAADRVELERLSRETDRSLAWIVREALRQYLSKTRDQEKSRAG
jgi:predicted transcriptional regulator